MANSGIATIAFENTDGTKQSFTIYDGQTFRVGRAPNNDLVLDDAGVSRMHAVFSASASGLVINDLSSLNGTFVNGKRISTPIDLTARDLVDIGPFKFSVQVHSSDMAYVHSPAGRTMTAQLKPVFVTLLVACIRGYSRFSQVLPQQDLVAMHKLWSERVFKIIGAQNGKIDKVVNDCVIAIWTGLDRPQIANQATSAALEINRQTWELCRTGKWTHDSTHPWDCRIVINSGSGLMGTVGAGNGVGKNFGVLGDTVNVAFKMVEVSVKPGNEIIVSDATAEYIRNIYKLHEIETLMPSDSSDPIRIYSIDPASPTL